MKKAIGILSGLSGIIIFGATAFCNFAIASDDATTPTTPTTVSPAVVPTTGDASNTSTAELSTFDKIKDKVILRLDTDTLTTRNTDKNGDEPAITGYYTMFYPMPAYKFTKNTKLWIIPEMVMFRNYTEKDQEVKTQYVLKNDSMGFRFDQNNILTEEANGINFHARFYARPRVTQESRLRNEEFLQTETRLIFSKKIGKYSVTSENRFYISDTNLDLASNPYYYYQINYLTQEYELSDKLTATLYGKYVTTRKKGGPVTNTDSLYGGPGFDYKFTDRFNTSFKLCSHLRASHKKNIFLNDVESVIDLNYDFGSRLSATIEFINPYMFARNGKLASRAGEFSVDALKTGSSVELVLSMYAW
ncbi:MAG: hypothetical protein HQK49_15525 [Oligoflexia bacterium]|nr:hypothetical protein [Oligoflexia bacterium]